MRGPRTSEIEFPLWLLATLIREMTPPEVVELLMRVESEQAHTAIDQAEVARRILDRRRAV